MNPVSSSTTSTSVPNNNVNAHPSQSRPPSLIAPPLINQGIAQPYPQGHFQQYPQSWFSAGPTQTPVYPQTGFKPSNVPSLFGPQPVVAASFSPVFQNPSGNQPSFMQQTGGPRNTSMPVLHSPTTQPSLTGPPYSSRPPMSISPQFAPVPASSNPMTAQVPSHGHNIIASQNILSGPPMNIPNRMVSPLSGPPQASGAVANQQSRGGFSPSESTHSIGPVQSAGGPAPMPFPMQSSAPPPPQPRFPNSLSGNALNFDSVRPVSAAISRPSSSDFTFQPHHRPPNAAAASQLWQGNQSIRHPVQGQASLPHQSPLLRPMVHNMNPPPVQDSFSRPQVNQPMSQIPPRHHPMMPGPTGPHMQPRNFIPPPHHINPFPPRPGSQMHIQDNHLAGPARPQRFPIHQQHFGRPFFTSSGAQQTYDPFSPTSPSHGR